MILSTEKREREDSKPRQQATQAGQASGAGGGWQRAGWCLLAGVVHLVQQLGCGGDAL